MIERHYEHSFETDLITKGGWGIDFGCGTDFFISQTLLNYGLKTIAVDPNPKIINIPNLANLYYENVALVTDKNCNSIQFNIYNDTDAGSLYSPKNDVQYLQKQNVISVPAATIDKIMKKYNVEQFEILKLDIEGGEYDFLMTIDFPIAKQISIEFHDFRGLNPDYPNNEQYYEKLFKKLKPWYQVAKHNVEKHPGLVPPYCYNYWDSLLTLRSL